MLRVHKGARPGEILGLWEESVDIDARLLMLRRTSVGVSSRDAQHDRTWEINPTKARGTGVSESCRCEDGRLLQDLRTLLSEAPQRRAAGLRRVDRELCRLGVGAHEAAVRAHRAGAELLSQGSWVLLSPSGAIPDLGNFGTRSWRPALEVAYPEGDPRRTLTFYELRHSAITRLRHHMDDRDLAILVGTSELHISTVDGRRNPKQVDNARQAMNRSFE